MGDSKFKIMRPRKEFVPGGSALGIDHQECAKADLPEAVRSIAPVHPDQIAEVEGFAETAEVGEHIKIPLRSTYAIAIIRSR